MQDPDKQMALSWAELNIQLCITLSAFEQEAECQPNNVATWPARPARIYILHLPHLPPTLPFCSRMPASAYHFTALI